MKTLNIAPPAKWVKFDDDLSFEVRRLPMRELMDLVDGTETGRIMFELDAAGRAEREATVPWRELVELAERVIDRMVTDWTVADPDGARVEVSLEAGRWLMTEVNGLASWLVLKILMPAFSAEGEIEAEKKG